MQIYAVRNPRDTAYKVNESILIFVNENFEFLTELGMLNFVSKLPMKMFFGYSGWSLIEDKYYSKINLVL